MSKFRYIDADAHKDPFAHDEEQSEFARLLEMDTSFASAKKYRVGESVSGTIVSASSEYIFVDLGGKNTGCITAEEFLTAGLSLPKVGETLQAFVRSDTGSEVVLTRSLRRSDADDHLLQQAFESKLPVEAKVEKLIKGGFEALIGTKRCFVPLSQMELHSIANPEVYLGNVFKFLITELKGKNIVLSRKGLLREEQESRRAEILETLEVGKSVKVKIARLTEFGAFASLDGIDCLIPLSELAWKRVKKADEVVRVDEIVNVKILKIERTPKLKILLSLKDAGEDPWIAMRTRLAPGEILEGVVTNFIDNGAFINVTDGIDGFVPISQITWEKRLVHPKEGLKVGQNVKAHVLSVDFDAKKLSLSIKGPMPEHLLNRFKDKKQEKEMSPEEQELYKQWEDYKNTAQKAFDPSLRESANIFAAAFQSAKNAQKKNVRPK